MKGWKCELFVFLSADNLSEALKTLKLSSGDSATDSIEGCLDCLLKALAHNSKSACAYLFSDWMNDSFCIKLDQSERKIMNSFFLTCLLYRTLYSPFEVSKDGSLNKIHLCTRTLHVFLLCHVAVINFLVDWIERIS